MHDLANEKHVISLCLRSTLANYFGILILNYMFDTNGFTLKVGSNNKVHLYS